MQLVLFSLVSVAVFVYRTSPRSFSSLQEGKRCWKHWRQQQPQRPTFTVTLQGRRLTSGDYTSESGCSLRHVPQNLNQGLTTCNQWRSWLGGGQLPCRSTARKPWGWEGTRALRTRQQKTEKQSFKLKISISICVVTAAFQNVAFWFSLSVEGDLFF